MSTGAYLRSSELERSAKPKGRRGDFTIDRKVERQKRIAAEQKEMKAAKKRDGDKCRVPRCQYKTLELKIDPAHMTHRGMGGNPKGDRTTRATVISLCRRHHDAYDIHDELRIEPLTLQDFDGPCEFYEKHQETGKWEHVGTESRIGVSVAVGR